jgi:hypothetical protein
MAFPNRCVDQLFRLVVNGERIQALGQRVAQTRCTPLTQPLFELAKYRFQLGGRFRNDGDLFLFRQNDRIESGCCRGRSGGFVFRLFRLCRLVELLTANR